MGNLGPPGFCCICALLVAVRRFFVYGGLVLVATLRAVPTQAQGSADTDVLAKQLETLITLHGEEYMHARGKLLARDDIVPELRELRNETKEWNVRLVSEALLFRKSDLRTTALFDTVRPRSSVFGVGGRKRHNRPVGMLHGDPAYDEIVISCFGGDYAAMVAEKLLYEWRVPIHRLSALWALAATRDPRGIDVVLSIAANSKEGTRIRAGAVTRLEKYLDGMGPVQIDVRKRFFRVPKEVAPLARMRKLPGLRVAKAQRARILATLLKIVAEAEGPQVRVAAARALKHGGAEAVEVLSRGALREVSSLQVHR